LKDIPDSFKPPKIKKSSQESSPEPGLTKRPAASSNSSSSSSNSSSSAAVAAVVRAAAVSQLKSSSELSVKKPSSTLTKSVFSRLGEQEGEEEEEEYVEKKKPDLKDLKKVQVEVTLKRPEAGIKAKKEVKKEKGSSSDEEYGPKQPVVKKEKVEKPSIFDRLEKVWLFLDGFNGLNERKSRLEKAPVEIIMKFNHDIFS
jgi:hypothetical protein